MAPQIAVPTDRFRTRFVLPDPDLPLHQVCFLCSHNAFSSQAHGYLWFQQRQSMVDQLIWYGVRALMLDIWRPSAQCNQGSIVLSHNKPVLNNLFLRERKFRRTGALRLVDELVKIKEQFLDRHSDEVIFIFFEDHVNDGPWLDRTLEAAGYQSLILTPNEWDPIARKGWPTRTWMNHHNKQVILFTDSLLEGKKKSRQVYTDTWRYVVENMYGTLRKEKTARQRPESVKYKQIPRYFYLFNWFAKFSSVARLMDSYRRINGKPLDEALWYAFEHGEQVQARFSNFIGLDEVDATSGTMNLVNCINGVTARMSPEERELYFRVMQGA